MKTNKKLDRLMKHKVRWLLYYRFFGTIVVNEETREEWKNIVKLAEMWPKFDKKYTFNPVIDGIKWALERFKNEQLRASSENN